MNRVCEPNGRVLQVEHGRSDVKFVGRFQDWRADAHCEKHGCQWTQEPLDFLATAAVGSQVRDCRCWPSSRRLWLRPDNQIADLDTGPHTPSFTPDL